MFKLTPDQKTTLVGVAGAIATIIVTVTGRFIDPNVVYSFLVLGVIILSITVGILGKLSPGIEKKINKDVSDIASTANTEFQTIVGGTLFKQFDESLAALAATKEGLIARTEKLQALLNDLEEWKKRSEEAMNQVRETLIKVESPKSTDQQSQQSQQQQ